jgi:hypothetical protein
MATRFSSIIPDCSTDANFRPIVQFIEDTLVTTGGWVVTSDTGQATLSTITHPTVANTKQGYRIYRMADSLQSTNPVFMRLDFGGSANPVVFGMWVTIGTGSNGSGTITGIAWNGGASATPNVANSGNSASAQNAYGSASTNRACIAIGIMGSVSNCQTVFTIERSKDSSGNDTGDGLLLCYNLITTTLNQSRYIILAGGTQPTAEGLSYVLTARNPSETFAPGDIGVGIVVPMKGVAQQPGMNVMIVNSSDVGAQGSFSMTVYGATHTYQHLDAMILPQKATAGSAVNDSNARVCIRYE